MINNIFVLDYGQYWPMLMWQYNPLKKIFHRNYFFEITNSYAMKFNYFKFIP